MRRTLISLLILLAGVASASEASDKEVLRYNDAVSKLRRAHDDALVKEKARTVAALSALAKRATTPTATAMAWEGVLALDRANGDARRYFQGQGNLDAVLAGLDGSDADVAGGGADSAKPEPRAAPVGAKDPPVPATVEPPAITGKEFTIAPEPSVKGVLGPLPAGTTLVFQYVDGGWSPVKGKTRSPDASETPPPLHLRVSGSANGVEGIIAVLPAGTAQTPATVRLKGDCERLYLGINLDVVPGDAHGEVHYRIEVRAP